MINDSQYFSKNNCFVYYNSQLRPSVTLEYKFEDRSFSICWLYACHSKTVEDISRRVSTITGLYTHFGPWNVKAAEAVEVRL